MDEDEEDSEERTPGEDDNSRIPTVEELRRQRVARMLMNQQRYMDMCTASANLLQMLSRIVPGVTNDLQVEEADGSSSDDSNSSPSPSPSEASSSSQPSITDGVGEVIWAEPLMSCQLYSPVDDDIRRLPPGTRPSAGDGHWNSSTRTTQRQTTRGQPEESRRVATTTTTTTSSNRPVQCSTPKGNGGSSNKSPNKTSCSTADKRCGETYACTSSQTTTFKTDVKSVGTTMTTSGPTQNSASDRHLSKDESSQTTTSPQPTSTSDDVCQTTRMGIHQAINEMAQVADSIREAREALSAFRSRYNVQESCENTSHENAESARKQANVETQHESTNDKKIASSSSPTSLPTTSSEASSSNPARRVHFDDNRTTFLGFHGHPATIANTTALQSGQCRRLAPGGGSWSANLSRPGCPRRPNQGFLASGLAKLRVLSEHENAGANTRVNAIGIGNVQTRNTPPRVDTNLGITLAVGSNRSNNKNGNEENSQYNMPELNIPYTTEQAMNDRSRQRKQHKVTLTELQHALQIASLLLHRETPTPERVNYTENPASGSGGDCFTARGSRPYVPNVSANALGKDKRNNDSSTSLVNITNNKYEPSYLENEEYSEHEEPRQFEFVVDATLTPVLREITVRNEQETPVNAPVDSMKVIMVKPAPDSEMENKPEEEEILQPEIAEGHDNGSTTEYPMLYRDKNDSDKAEGDDVSSETQELYRECKGATAPPQSPNQDDSSNHDTESICNDIKLAIRKLSSQGLQYSESESLIGTTYEDSKIGGAGERIGDTLRPLVLTYDTQKNTCAGSKNLSELGNLENDLSKDIKNNTNEAVKITTEVQNQERSFSEVNDQKHQNEESEKNDDDHEYNEEPGTKIENDELNDVSDKNNEHVSANICHAESSNEHVSANISHADKSNEPVHVSANISHADKSNEPVHVSANISHADKSDENVSANISHSDKSNEPVNVSANICHVEENIDVELPDRELSISSEVQKSEAREAEVKADNSDIDSKIECCHVSNFLTRNPPIVYVRDMSVGMSVPSQQSMASDLTRISPLCEEEEEPSLRSDTGKSNHDLIQTLSTLQSEARPLKASRRTIDEATDLVETRLRSSSIKGNYTNQQLPPPPSPSSELSILYLQQQQTDAAAEPFTPKQESRFRNVWSRSIDNTQPSAHGDVSGKSEDKVHELSRTASSSTGLVQRFRNIFKSCLRSKK